MLKEIVCDKFKCNGENRGTIYFHSGLNIVLGSESGANSIGKSTFLMIIDFVFGGNDYIDKLKELQVEIGDHNICFAFQFGDEVYYFSRSNYNHKNVHKCNSNYEIEDTITLKEYISFLEIHYDLQFVSFRDAISRFIRIYKRDTLDENNPLLSHKQENSKSAIKGLLKINNLYDDIEKQYKLLEETKEKYNLFKKAQEYKYIPSVKNGSEYKKNEKKIKELTEKLNNVIFQSSNNLFNLESFQHDKLLYANSKLSKLKIEHSKLTSQLQAIKIDKNFDKDIFEKNLKQLIYFFPNVNFKNIEDVENFHLKLTNILQEEFLETEKKIKSNLDFIESEIKNVENLILEISESNNLPQLVLKEYAEIDNELRVSKIANKNYIKTRELSDDYKNANKTLNELVSQKLQTLQEKINSEMLKINNKIYDGNKNSPILSITDSSHYKFFTPKDSGTGTQYKGVIVFDLAILNITNIPIIVHDSILLKHIENEAIEKIMELYTKTSKQIFIAIDKKSSYTEKTAKIIEENNIINLNSGSEALFGYTWNDK